MFFRFAPSVSLFFLVSVAFNLGASLCVAGPSKARYLNKTCHHLAAIAGLSRFNADFCSPAVGVGALKKEAAAATVKRKDASSESKTEKKRKSALEEIIEVETNERGL